MIGQLPPEPRRTRSSPEQQAITGTPPRDGDAVTRLAAELATVQGRLHDALEVLEGVLAERSALLRETRELREQLAASLAQQHGGQEAGEEQQAVGTPARVLRQELLLAQAQLGELRQAQAAWEAERHAMLSELEEERARLQEGLSQALTQASCAQREADAAAERAAHWCSLADVLQTAALLPDGPASPEGSATASLSATPASRMASTHASTAPTSVLSSSSVPRSLGRVRSSDAAHSAARLLAEWRPAAAVRQPAAGSRYASASGGGGSPQGSGLLKAFQAVAEAPASPAEPASAAAGQAAQAAPSAEPASAGAHAAKLRLKRLDASPAGHSPLTPLPHMALPIAAAATPATTTSGASTRSAAVGAGVAHKPKSMGLLGRLASLTACGAGLAAERIK